MPESGAWRVEIQSLEKRRPPCFLARKPFDNGENCADMRRKHFLRKTAHPSLEDDDEDSSRGEDSSGRADGLLWYKDSRQHVNGEFLMAVIQANNALEDHSQLESGPLSLVDSGLQRTSVRIMMAI
ncbi:hypothetical protein RJ639_037810 [Escallonia herrerae]|uniref:Uncharacterized protein n=1 Tax=Escallonia herrerae TaxID=1293975 RepID=A0AA89B6J1_9ASTE|nr:hypothetical protein RJ639_037810 [Escallonia herrerae]